MQLSEIKKEIWTPKYDFLRTNEHLGDNIILLGLGGSHAYGTETETSDLDVRGIALNSRKEILLRKDFKQVHNDETDTTIYSFNKMIGLLSDCNPNTIELLGLKPEHYLSVSPAGKLILDNRDAFLSQKAIYTFGEYAIAQMRRLENLAVRSVDPKRREEHILETIKHMMYYFKERYTEFPEDAIKLFIAASMQEDYDTEIYMDIHLTQYPLRDWKDMWSEMNAVVKSYAKIGKRNKNALEHNKIGKHMCHLLRLYIMAIDILTKHEIKTYRDEEHQLLMDTRNDKYLAQNNQPTPEFWEILHGYEEKFNYAKENTDLPEKPDYERIDWIKETVNESVVLGKQNNIITAV